MVDLPPISAALTAYSCIIAHGNGNWGLLMQDVTAETAKKTTQKTDHAAKTPMERPTLDSRYGQIGISAVAAAARYQGAAKNSAYAPVPTKWNDRADEAA
jgi:hypothetical protein